MIRTEVPGYRWHVLQNGMLKFRTDDMEVPLAAFELDSHLNYDERHFLTPKDLVETLSICRDAIEVHMLDRYEEAKKDNPGHKIGTPSIWTLQLGTESQSEGSSNVVFSESGLANNELITREDELNEPYRAYWRGVIEAADGHFQPTVLRVGGKALGGAWLCATKPDSN